MIKKFILPALFFLAALSPAAGQTPDYARWVNPFIGTGGHGHTFPGATVPFGMAQLSPDTRTDNWDGSSGYHYSDDIIYGFSHTHLSGTGIPDYCDILFMPTVGEPGFFKPFEEKGVEWYASKFSHANEHAGPGYYSVKLDNGDILAELTATARVGIHRYTFPKAGDAHVVLDLKWRDKRLDSDIKIVGNRIEGFRRSSSWAKDQIVYFVAEFSKPFTGPSPQSGVVCAGGYPGQPAPTTPIVDHYDTGKYQVVFHFDVKAGEQILLKVAISSVSVEGARRNLEAELPGWDFDNVRADAKAAWNKELSKIEVSGGTDAQTTTFYTALYHTMIQPNIFNDVDGNYRGLDGKVHFLGEREAEIEGGRDGNRSVPRSRPPAVSPSQYTVFSLWDTFRAAHPLYTIIDQQRTADFINTFIRMYEQGGRLPVWELAGNETDTMIGYHAVSVIADAMSKGIKGFDYEKAYEAAKHSAELDRDGLAAYKKRGYISSEDDNESVSKTLEYAYDDWCIAQMGQMLFEQRLAAYERNGDHDGALNDKHLQQVYDDYHAYLKRSENFENLFDPSTGFMRPRKNGGFTSPFAPNEVTFNYTEGNAWVYSFFVPQNVPRLMDLEGGPAKFAAKLDALFTTSDKLTGREQPDITGLIGQYAHGNEPSHHIAYLYNYAGQPWKTQKYVRQILENFYKPTPDGLIGNEDCGQMSAWYVMSALGLYEVAPGSPDYALSSPLFEKAVIRLENGRTFTINAPGANRLPYVRSIRSDRQELNTAFFPHSSVMEGGTLNFEMSAMPVRTAMDTPFRVGDVLQEHDTFVATPVVKADKRVFRDSMEIAFETLTEDAGIRYTLDGTAPTATSPRYEYGKPIRLTKTTNVKTIAIGAYNEGRDISPVADATFIKKPNNWTVSVASKYNRQYTGGGDEGLIDGIRGTTSFASDEWQGYQGQDFVATVDLQKETTIGKVGGGFLQNARSWIWMPTHIEFEVSSDGVNFTRVADIKTDVDPTDMDPKIRDYTQAISPVNARYVRVRAYNLGKIPTWHPGAGDDAFIFVDEIIIQ